MSTEQVSSLLQTLYAASADPSLFPEFLQRLQDYTRSSRAYLLMSDAIRGNNVAAQANWDPYYTRLYAERFSDDDPLVSATIVQQRRNGGDWAGDRTSVLADDVYYRHASFQEMLVPVKDLHLCGTMMSMPDGSYGSLVLRRERQHRSFEPEVISLLNILIPHLKQSLKLHGLLKSEQTRAEIMATSVDAFHLAVLAVDSRCRIHHASSAARATLATNNGLVLRDGALCAVISRENTQLRGLIAGAVSTALGQVEHSAKRRSRVIPLQATRAACFSPHAGGVMRITRTPPFLALNVSVMPFTSDAQLLEERPAALVFLHDPTQPPLSRGDILRALFGLTPAESRVADLLLRGMDAREIAERMHLTLETSRFQIKRVLTKTGSRKQSDLLRMTLALPGSA